MRNNTLVRSAGAGIGILLCVWGIWSAGAAGLSKLYLDYALAVGSLPHADEAVRRSPSDPEAHYARALVLQNKGNPAEAIGEFEQAVRLRPRDYVLWYELALARDNAGDAPGAIAACEESVRLAPYYGRTHWLHGNLLYRAGRLDEAFTDLRRAASSDAEFLPNLIDLAWGTYRGDARVVQDVVQPQTNNSRIALAKFFAQKGKFDEAIALFNLAEGDTAKTYCGQLLTQLLDAGRFKEAYEIWATSRRESAAESKTGINQITDPGFEGTIKLNEPGFGWHQQGNPENVHISLDTNEPQGGTRSLLINYNGNANPSSPVLSQLVLVEPDTQYSLHFYARTRDVVTGGLPQLSVTDATGPDEGKTLKTAALSPKTLPWRDYSLEFTTRNRTQAIIINVTRQNCSTNPCPIFGDLWLDDFSLQKLANHPR
jgi:tetratricopeptide (TPR) repeat protein